MIRPDVSGFLTLSLKRTLTLIWITQCESIKSKQHSTSIAIYSTWFKKRRGPYEEDKRTLRKERCSEIGRLACHKSDVLFYARTELTVDDGKKSSHCCCKMFKTDSTLLPVLLKKPSSCHYSLSLSSINKNTSLVYITSVSQFLTKNV